MNAMFVNPSDTGGGVLVVATSDSSLTASLDL